MQQLINHQPYLMALDKSKDLESIGFYLSEHLKVAGGYWTINALACLNVLDDITQDKKTQLSQWLKGCQNPDGGFGGNTNHDSHITNTHYAVLLSFLLNCPLDYDAAANYMAARQKKDGSFEGDQWGEVDARFSYCALSSLTLLGKRSLVDIKKAAGFIKKCRNFDGSFGGIPDAESHGAYVFCCVGTLYLCEDLSFNIDELAMWIHERQTNKGGLNGRPEKLADVCYSWWMYSALCLLKKEQWINQNALEQYILCVKVWLCSVKIVMVALLIDPTINLMYSTHFLVWQHFPYSMAKNISYPPLIQHLPYPNQFYSIFQEQSNLFDNYIFMSRGNQRVQLPQIKQENYNFVTSKKKTVQFQQPLPQDDFMEDWKKKCEDLQRDVETRNQTIFSIQRNFESLSAILKNEKQENLGIKDEVLRLREILSNQQSQEREQQFKIAEGLKKIKELSQYQELLSEERKITQKCQIDINNLKNQISNLEVIIHRKEGEIRQLSSNLLSLQGDLAQLPNLIEENTAVKQELIKSKELIQRHEKSIADKELNLQVSFQNNTQLNSLIENLKLDFGAAQGTIKHLQAEENISLAKIAKQQQEIVELQTQLKVIQDRLNNQNTLLYARNQQDGQQNQIIVTLQKDAMEQQKQYQVIIQENKNLSEFIKDNMRIIEQYQQVSSVYGEIDLLELMKDYQLKQQEYKISQEELLKVTQQLDYLQQQYTQLSKQIKEIQQQKQEILLQKQEISQKCQLLEEEAKLHLSLKSSTVNSEQMIKNLSTQLKHKSENELALLQQIKNMQSQLTKYNEYDGLIISYQKYTQPVEFVLSSELNEFKENIQQLTQSNKLYLEDIQRRTQQIEELNIKLQDMEELNNLVKTLENDANQLKTKLEQSHSLIDEISSDRKKYKMRIDTLESQINGINQENRNLSKQIMEQTEHVQSLTTKYQVLQRENKDIQDQNYKMGLDIKNLTAKCKKSEEELELLNPDKLRGLQMQLEQKEKEFQSQLSNISLALDSQITSISCNQCMEVMQKSVTCHPCGHSFCEKCFKNECSECQDQDGWFKNKRLDDLISKINYSKEILNTYKKKQ